jgi:hypothetical protein
MATLIVKVDLQNIKRPRVSVCCDTNKVVEHERSLRGTRGVAEYILFISQYIHTSDRSILLL